MPSKDASPMNRENHELKIADFLSKEKYALYGMSRAENKFGNKVYQNLTPKGYKLFPIHPKAKTIQGVKCWPDFNTLPEKVDGAIMVIPPEQTEIIVKEIANAGIKRVWMQPGAESEEAIEYCEKNGIAAIYQECVMVRSKGGCDGS
jgi:predicted CoA-binding protein